MKFNIGRRTFDNADDGVTHLNVYSGSRTQLGRWLSAFTKVDLELEHGKFASTEAYYHWLKIYLGCTRSGVNTARFNTMMEKLRRLDGLEAIQYGRVCKKCVEDNGVKLANIPTPEFQRFYKEAIKVKLLSNQFMLNELLSVIEDGIPVVHYYDYRTSVVHKARFDWTADVIVSVANTLRVNA